MTINQSSQLQETTHQFSSEIDENATSYTEIRLHREIFARKEHTHCRWTFTSSYTHGDEIPYIDVIIHDITDVPESRLEKIKDETKCDETLQALARTEIDENATSYTEIRLHREICSWKEHTHCRWTFTSSYSWR